MDKKMMMWVWLAVAVIVVALGLWAWQYYSSPSSSSNQYGSTTQNSQTDNTQNDQTANNPPAASNNYPLVASSLSYTQAARIYANKKIEFSENCVPSTLTQPSFKLGTTIMIRNAGSKTKLIDLDEVGYSVKSDSFILVNLTTNAKLPHTVKIDCGSGENNVSINLEK